MEDQNLAQANFEQVRKATTDTSLIIAGEVGMYEGIAIAVNIIANNQKLLSRRRFLKIAGYSSMGIGLSKALSIIGVNNLSDPETDKLAIELHNFAPNPTDPMNIEWFATGRTALVTEKLMDLQQKNTASKKVAMLFGSGHLRNATKVLTDEKYRLDKIQQFCQTAREISYALLTKTGRSQQEAEQISNGYAKNLANYSVAHIEGSDDNREITHYTSEKIQKAIQ